MRTTEQVTVPHTYTRTTAIVCDVCGKNGRDLWNTDEGVDWDRHEGIQFDVTGLFKRKGYTCPDGGQSDNVEYHVCPTCMDKVFEFVASIAKTGPHKTSTDW